MRTVLHILSTSYAGSSLLNLLLDAQPAIRGLGEVYHDQLDQGVACTRCGPLANCHMRLDLSRFYGSAFDFYPDAKILVDASKSLWRSLLLHPPEHDVQHAIIVLSKTPHGFARSTYRHDRLEVWQALEQYLTYYECVINQLATDPRAIGIPRLNVTYRDLCERTDDVLSQIGELCGTSMQPVAETRWWESDSHIIGGNYMVAAQVTGFQEQLQRSSTDVVARYKDKEQKIIYDAEWSCDVQFMRVVHFYYSKLRDRLGGCAACNRSTVTAGNDGRVGREDWQRVLSCHRSHTHESGILLAGRQADGAAANPLRSR